MRNKLTYDDLDYTIEGPIPDQEFSIYEYGNLLTEKMDVFKLYSKRMGFYFHMPAKYHKKADSGNRNGILIDHLMRCEKNNWDSEIFDHINSSIFRAHLMKFFVLYRDVVSGPLPEIKSQQEVIQSS